METIHYFDTLKKRCKSGAYSYTNLVINMVQVLNLALKIRIEAVRTNLFIYIGSFFTKNSEKLLKFRAICAIM